MSVFSLNTQNLSWQDRTINVEFMVAPAKSQLLYNKHKGLKTKFEQESYYLEREKESYLKAFKTEQRLMERRKENYSKRRNDIILRRASAERRRSSVGGRFSAPPRLEQDVLTESKADVTFITAITARVSKSAGARTFVKEPRPLQQEQHTGGTKLEPPAVPDLRTVSPCFSVRTVTPGKPHLHREKSVRFENMKIIDTSLDKENVQLPIQDRIKNFLVAQTEFNKTGPKRTTEKLRRQYESSNREQLARRRSSFNLNMSKLETAFEEFCLDGSSDGLNKLVKYASKMRAFVRNVRPPSTVTARQEKYMVEV